MAIVKRVISIVDDHDDTRDAINLLLESYGWTTNPYASAKEFLEELDEKQLPDILIFDLDMRDGNSSDHLWIVNHLNNTIPIVMLTVDIAYPHAQKAADNGATVLQKPVMAKNLIKAIESLI